ncbi:ATP-dependent Clp protease proteolytic subunit [Litoribacillus peritrichatus]|uniref:Serine dehydrogenase proteinase n=1 Tax=Litoribacillus peritrichatus TaxID=718191 RepID=A0ABP7N4D4_9GAMM
MIERTEDVKEPPLLFEETQQVLKKISDLTSREIIVYWSSGRGSVCDNDVIALYEILEKIGPSRKAGIFIKSGGGDVEAALRIVNMLRERFDDLVAYIPLECASAATMICLGANEIHMGPLAHLTAIDSSLRHDLSPIDETDNRRVSVSQDELSRLIQLWNSSSKDHHGNPYSDIFKYVHPLVIGAIDRASSLSIKICQEILSYHIQDSDECLRISTYLNSEYPSHTYPITSREAKKIGLNIKSLDQEINRLLLEMSEYYSEMAQKAITDFDEYNYHDNEILNIIEGKDIQVFFQNDKDWNYIKEERRWQSLNNESSWRKVEFADGKKTKSTLHIR